MLRRRGRPGLVETMARTAVVAGSATAVVGGVPNRQANQQAAQQDQAAAVAPAPAADDTIAQLQRLGDMKTAGLLTDAEFTAAKAKLLS